MNPGRDIGPTSIHGIAAADVTSAPRFEEIAGTVLDQLSDSIIVGHNIDFDLSFILAGLDRLGVDLPVVPCVCTLALSYELDIPSKNRRLSSCCQAFGITHSGTHSALGDAKATAQLLSALLRTMDRPTLDDLECTGKPIPCGSFSSLKRSDALCTRGTAATARQESEHYLSRLVAKLPLWVGRLPDDATDRSAVLGYADLLDRAIEDRHITIDEAHGLIQFAIGRKLSQEVIERVHLDYLEALVKAAYTDGILGVSERNDLTSVTRWLGLSDASLTDALAKAQAGTLSSPLLWERVASQELTGKTVCFTGEVQATLGGEPITREMAIKFAERAGLLVKSSVSKKLDILVVADPLSLSGKAKKAREYEVRVVAEAVFWQMLRIPVD